MDTQQPPPLPLTPTQFLGRFQLSEEGHRWAAMGYPEESAGRATNITVNVDIRMAVTNVIEQAQESEADQDLKDRFELLMRRIEAELQKPTGQGSMQPVKDVLEVANNAKGLMGPAVKFMADHWDKIQTFGGMPF